MSEHTSTDGGEEQAPLFESETVVDTEEVPASVWVVASRKEGSPHPYVEAVYDNEGAAREHKQELARNSFQHGVVAWDVFEQPVESTPPEDEATHE